MIGKIEITEELLESFKRAVEEKMQKEGKSFVIAVCQVLDDFTAREIQNSGVVIACEKGCAKCCYQLITCTEPEIDEIAKFIKGLPRASRRPLQVRIKKIAQKWLDYWQKNEILLKVYSFKQIEDWWGKPCPFLNLTSQSCDIYPVRTIDCRTLRSTTPCVTGKEPVRFMFPFDFIASNMILEEAQRKTGILGVTPITHWFLVKKPW